MPSKNTKMKIFNCIQLICYLKQSTTRTALIKYLIIISTIFDLVLDNCHRRDFFILLILTFSSNVKAVFKIVGLLYYIIFSFLYNIYFPILQNKKKGLKFSVRVQLTVRVFNLHTLLKPLTFSKVIRISQEKTEKNIYG